MRGARAGLSPLLPLASGLLTGKYQQRRVVPAGTRLAEAGGSWICCRSAISPRGGLTEFAAARRHTLLELAVSWLLSRPAVASVIAGATSPEQVALNASAAGWPPTPAELAEIDAAPARYV